MKLKALVVIAVVVVGGLLLGACQNVTPQQAKAIVATYEALPAPQRTAIAEKAATVDSPALTAFMISSFSASSRSASLALDFISSSAICFFCPAESLVTGAVLFNRSIASS